MPIRKASERRIVAYRTNTNKLCRVPENDRYMNHLGTLVDNTPLQLQNNVFDYTK